MTTTEMLVSLTQETGCPACGGKKKKRQSLCRECYHALPADQARALYQPFGNGYEAAFKAAMETLADRQPPVLRELWDDPKARQKHLDRVHKEARKP